MFPQGFSRSLAKEPTPRGRAERGLSQPQRFQRPVAGLNIPARTQQSSVLRLRQSLRPVTDRLVPGSNSSLPFGRWNGTFHSLYMESEVTPSLSFFKLVSWFDANKKQVLWGAAILAALALIVCLIIQRQGQKEE